MNELFFELIRVSIGTQGSLSRRPSDKEWKELFAMAKKQSLVGVCFAGVQRLAEDDRPLGIMYLKWMGLAAKIQQRNDVVNRRCVELQERLAKDGFRTYIMKGQGNAALYGDRLSSLRQSGDIDIYLEGGLEKVLTYAKSFGTVEHVNELEMTVPVFTDAEVEFHYQPFIMRNPLKNNRLQAFFNCQKEACLSNKVSLSEELTIFAPTPEFNLVHQLAHIHLHLFTEGIGLRQLMDYYFVLRNTNLINEPNYSLIEDTVEDLGMGRFASALMWVLGRVFGLERDAMLWEPDEEDGKLLLSEVMTGGNFGRYNEEQNDRKDKIGYSLWAVFFRNLKLSRFDRGDWFWGPLWRISHKLTRRKI